jgi:hypothetical protein
VRLVDREQRQAALVEQLLAALGQQPFRSDVDEVQLAAPHRRLDRPRLARRQRRVQVRRPHAKLAQRRDLVGHQRDQRRDHHAHALAQQRRDLVADRLAAAGGHQHQRVAAGGDVLDDLLLEAAEALVPEDLAQDRLRIASFHGRRG